MKKGGKEGIENRLRDLDDEEKKLKSARRLRERKKKPIKAECDIYPPENGEKLVVQIPDKIPVKFKYEEIAGGGIAVPYDEEKEKEITEEREKLENLMKKFEKEKTELKKAKDSLRDKIGKRKDELIKKKTNLEGQKTVLEADKKSYLEALKKIAKNDKLVKRLDVAKDIFNKLYNALSEEESLRRIRKETVAFINRIYERVYGWDINAKLKDENKIIITDAQGNIRSHPSGSEIHIMGLAWRWMVARAFDLPLVLDELDALLDKKNFEKTKKLIEEGMDRQLIILTLKESLKDLPGKIYRVSREERASIVVDVES